MMRASVVIAAIVNAVMWIACSAAIIYAVGETGKMTPLWFLLIPAFCGVSIKYSRD